MPVTKKKACKQTSKHCTRSALSLPHTQSTHSSQLTALNAMPVSQPLTLPKEKKLCLAMPECPSPQPKTHRPSHPNTQGTQGAHNSHFTPSHPHPKTHKDLGPERIRRPMPRSRLVG
ncbi:uncharacterized protein K452DRAFT_287361 [Aplosporella prunicola CBS 121167]|uniref:Uncharacterized protein n=1 Tax=Aplosporella prunicola CBS 121167 TaxID=1176127 RepID=A0A6A6BFX1_9PEZI|nr:uncharacterized protein K452DRAFT_287361 [Aplosporella prunicola CBS 121167]KAF2142144.1 hypothetical protein K452DRAFT_287361 [Aplosporella prunicola CBS 121167]